MVYKIGLTGNIGCGKSTIGRMLEALGAEYVDADTIVHELYRPETEETARIVARFGEAVRGESGAVDRAKLARIVFSDPQALKDLEAILHPSVRQRIRQRVAACRAPVVVVDAIKLLETGLSDEMDTVWVVTCTPEQQVRRLMETRGYTEDEARRRISAQSPQEEKVRRAAVVIDNSGSLEAAWRQVREAWQRLPLED